MVQTVAMASPDPILIFTEISDFAITEEALETVPLGVAGAVQQAGLNVTKGYW